MSKPLIGRLISDPSVVTRDAIHVPILPIQAATRLSPGTPATIVDGRAVSCLGTAMSPMGVVDPFLVMNVQPKEWFYLFLRPESTRRLWHEWTRPDIDRAIGIKDS